MHTEYCIPAEDLAEFNSDIVGLIVVTAEFPISAGAVAADLGSTACCFPSHAWSTRSLENGRTWT
jgi:hypothetical protein